MKRIVEIIMSAFLAFILAACTGTASNQAEKNEQKGEQNSVPAAETAETKPAEGAKSKLLYMGHASLRITTAEGKVIYIDPFVGNGYEPAADLILVTHAHFDHNAFFFLQ